MAKGKNTGKKKKSRYSDIEKFAYNLGCVTRGQQSDTLVRDSYNKGLQGPSPRTKKPVC